EREQKIGGHLRVRQDELLRDVLLCRTGIVRLALHDRRLRLLAGQDTDPVVSFPYRREDHGHDGDDRETACGGALHAADPPIQLAAFTRGAKVRARLAEWVNDRYGARRRG